MPGLPGLRLEPLPLVGATTASPRDGAWLELTSPSRDVRFLSLAPRRLLNPPASTGMGFWSINPYVGCEFGCAYCYARGTHRWTVDRAARAQPPIATAQEVATLPPAEAFERRILVKQGAAAVLARTLDPARIADRPIVIGTATDPYQPAERRFGLTRSLLKELENYRGLHLGLITKSTLIRRDIPLLVALSARHRVTVHLSLASLDAGLLRRLEPRTPIPQARLRTLRALAQAGLRVHLLIAPILPGLTDGTDALHALLLAAREAGAHWADGSPLRMGDATRATLLPWLQRERPALFASYQRHYARRQRVAPHYAEALRERLRTLQHRTGFQTPPAWSPSASAAPAPLQTELAFGAHPPIA